MDSVGERLTNHSTGRSPGKLRILLVSGSYPPMRCGVGDYTRCLAESLAGYESITLKVLTTVSLPAHDGDPSWLHRSMRNWQLGSLGPYLQLLRDFQPNIVHAQYPARGYSVWTGPAVIPILARAWSRASVVETWHEYPYPASTMAGCAMLALAAAANALIYVRPDYPQHINETLSKLLGRAKRHFVPNASVVPAVQLTDQERAQTRADLGCGARRLIAFFGFAHPHKGVDRLFHIADPTRDHLMLIGELYENDPYHADLIRLATSPPWRGHVTFSGFVEPARAAHLLASADAAVFPFLEGGGVWNSSVHAAVSQGTFTLMTSHERSGYSVTENVYYAIPSGVDQMRVALTQHVGTRIPPDTTAGWDTIAKRHIEIYGEVCQPVQDKDARR